MLGTNRDFGSHTLYMFIPNKMTVQLNTEVFSPLGVPFMEKEGCSLTSFKMLLSFGRDPTTIAFRDSLFPWSQSFKQFRSSLLNLFKSWIFFYESERLVSSAYMVTLQFRRASGRSFM